MEEFKTMTPAELDALDEDKTTVMRDRSGDIEIRPEGRGAYTITADRIDTPEKLVVWLLHLSEKVWGTPEVLHQVAQLAAVIGGFSIPWGC